MSSGNKTVDICELRFERISDVDVLSNFVCGLSDVDEFIHNELYNYVGSGGCELYIVKDTDEIVAMFCLDKSTLTLGEVAKEKMQGGVKPVPQHNPAPDDTYWWRSSYEAVEITYLAVAKDRRNQHIGSLVIEAIMERVAASDSSADYVIVRALQCEDGYTAVPFYEKCGFFLAEKRVATKNLFMYRVVMR